MFVIDVCPRCVSTSWFGNAIMVECCNFYWSANSLVGNPTEFVLRPLVVMGNRQYLNFFT